MESIVKLLPQQPDFASLTGASEKDIAQAEQDLGLCFSSAYRKYASAFGAASFAGNELTGVCKSKRLNVVDITLEERKHNHVPADWYVLEQTHIDGIVIWQATDGTIYQTAPYAAPIKLCDSLADYVLL